MTLCLTMIVKDEARIIRRCLKSARPLIDYWVIVDTGSTDATKKIVRSALKGIPGELHDRPWVNFAHNRNEALELAAGKADYMLSLDADYTIEVDGGVLIAMPDLTAGAYNIGFTGPLDYALPLIFRDGARFHGAIHEGLTFDGALSSLPMLKVTHHGDGSNRDGRLERDAKAFNDVLGSFENLRATYYLAQTYKDMGHLEAAADLYGRRSRMGGFEEEAWHARYMEGVMLLRVDDDRGVTVLLDAFERRPTRAEPLHTLAAHFNYLGKPHLAMTFAELGLQISYPYGDMLFVERDVYEHALEDERRIAADSLSEVTQ